MVVLYLNTVYVCFTNVWLKYTPKRSLAVQQTSQSLQCGFLSHVDTLCIRLTSVRLRQLKSSFQQLFSMVDQTIVHFCRLFHLLQFLQKPICKPNTYNVPEVSR